MTLWIVIFTLLGFYLLGKIRFSHDGDQAFVTLPRLLLAIVALAFATYLVPGLWGAPLQAVAAFLPPQTTQDFDLYTPTLLGGGGGIPAPAAPASGSHKYGGCFTPRSGSMPFRLRRGYSLRQKSGQAGAHRLHRPRLRKLPQDGEHRVAQPTGAAPAARQVRAHPALRGR